MEKHKRSLYIDPRWIVMPVLKHGGVIKSMLSWETGLSILTKQNFDLLLTEP